MNTVTKEDVEYWYGRQEDEKKKIPFGSSLGTYYYCDSGHESFAYAALMLVHNMFCWECDHPAPEGKFWTFSVPERKLHLVDRSPR